MAGRQDHQRRSKDLHVKMTWPFLNRLGKGNESRKVAALGYRKKFSVDSKKHRDTNLQPQDLAFASSSAEQRKPFAQNSQQWRTFRQLKLT